MAERSERRHTMAKLLLVDDERDLLEALSTLFTLEGYQVAATHSAHEALSILLAPDQDKPDLIISDVIMPQMTGRELLATVRANTTLADIPFLFVSATVISEDEELIARTQTVRYLRKPFLVEDLCALVAEMIRLRANSD
jgi:CheY-like chemotaxis protein